MTMVTRLAAVPVPVAQPHCNSAGRPDPIAGPQQAEPQRTWRAEGARDTRGPSSLRCTTVSWSSGEPSVRALLGALCCRSASGSCPGACAGTGPAWGGSEVDLLGTAPKAEKGPRPAGAGWAGGVKGHGPRLRCGQGWAGLGACRAVGSCLCCWAAAAAACGSWSRPLGGRDGWGGCRACRAARSCCRAGDCLAGGSAWGGLLCSALNTGGRGGLRLCRAARACACCCLPAWGHAGSSTAGAGCTKGSGSCCVRCPAGRDGARCGSAGQAAVKGAGLVADGLGAGGRAGGSGHWGGSGKGTRGRLPGRLGSLSSSSAALWASASEKAAGGGFCRCPSRR